jgi:predicted RNase H-like HicB family nuclease
MTDWYDTELEWDPDERVWVSYVRGLGGLSTYGDTLAEALFQTADMISGYLETAKAEGIPVPAPGRNSL